MTLVEKTEDVQQLDRLLQDTARREITIYEFVSEARGLKAPTEWLENHLRSAMIQWDILKVCVLCDAMFIDVVDRHSSRIHLSVSLFCDIMLDPRTDGGDIELIADAISYCSLTREHLDKLVQVCTSPRWKVEGWADFRKVMEAIVAAYRWGACSKSEFLEILNLIITSPETQSEDCGLRDFAASMIEVVRNEPGNSEAVVP